MIIMIQLRDVYQRWYPWQTRRKTVLWCSFSSSSSVLFSGNWNGTESVEERDFLWGARYDSFSARCHMCTYLLWCYIQNQKLSLKGFVLRNLSVWRNIRNVSTVRVHGHLPPLLYGRNVSPDELMRTAQTRWYADLSANETQMQARGEVKMKSRTKSRRVLTST